MNILVIGPGKSGKTVSGDIIARKLNSGRSISTSEVLIDLYIKELHDHGIEITKQQILDDKENHRTALWNLGRNLQKGNPAAVAIEALKLATTNGNAVVTGVRNSDEMIAVKSRKLFDIIIYIQRDACDDHTFHLSPVDADMTVLNNGNLADLENNLSFIGLYLPPFSH